MVTKASPRLTSLCILRARSARKPGNVLPPLSGAAGFESRPSGRRSLRSNQLEATDAGVGGYGRSVGLLDEVIIPGGN